MSGITRSHPLRVREYRPSGEKVLCPTCEEAGQRSTVSVRPCAVTAMMHYPYYDEDGNHHNHDPNGPGYYYRCSNDHAFGPHKRPCPTCGYAWE